MNRKSWGTKSFKLLCQYDDRARKIPNCEKEEFAKPLMKKSKIFYGYV